MSTHTAQLYLNALEAIKGFQPKWVEKRKPDELTGELPPPVWDINILKNVEAKLKRASLTPESPETQLRRYQQAVDAQVYKLPRLALLEEALVDLADKLKAVAPESPVFAQSLLRDVVQELTHRTTELGANYQGTQPSMTAMGALQAAGEKAFKPVLVVMSALPATGCVPPLGGAGLAYARGILGGIMGHRAAIMLTNRKGKMDDKEVVKEGTEAFEKLYKGLFVVYTDTLVDALYG